MERLQNIKLYLFDMDGTLYLGQRLYDFTKELLQTIRTCGRKYLFVTNNSSKSVDKYIEKLASMGINAVKDDFTTSAQATGLYLQKHKKRTCT
jgi:NagD protein